MTIQDPKITRQSEPKVEYCSLRKQYQSNIKQQVYPVTVTQQKRTNPKGLDWSENLSQVNANQNIPIKILIKILITDVMPIPNPNDGQRG